MGLINYPPDGEARYATGTVVNLTATADDGSTFLFWEGDVPEGHETDNPLAITMDAYKVLTARFDVVARDSALRVGGDSCFGLGVDFPYFQLIVAGDTFPTLPEAECEVPFSGTFTKMIARVTPAPDPGQSITFVVVLNGVEQSELSTTIPEGQRQVITAGSLAFAEGDLIAMKANFAGGMTDASVQLVLMYNEEEV